MMRANRGGPDQRVTLAISGTRGQVTVPVVPPGPSWAVTPGWGRSAAPWHALTGEVPPVGWPRPLARSAASALGGQAVLADRLLGQDGLLLDRGNPPDGVLGVLALPRRTGVALLSVSLVE